MSADAPLSMCREGDVWVVNLHSGACNEIGESMILALEGVCDKVERSSAGAVVIASRRTGGFSAGADLRSLHAAMLEETLDVFREKAAGIIDRIHGVMNRLHQMPLTTIAAVHGVCFGGGFELALACDLIVADKTARFCFPELRLGLVPGFGGVPRLREEVPNAVVRDLLLTGRSMSAQRAHELGFVSQVVGEGKAPRAAQMTARQAALFGREVTGAAKAFMRPLPKEALDKEKLLFLMMLEQPRVRTALADFVSRTDAMPYQVRAHTEQEKGRG